MNIQEKYYSIQHYSICSYELKQNNHSKGTIVIIHGFRQYSGIFLELAQTIHKEGYSVYLLDLPHHGRSSGEPRTWIDSMETLVSVSNEYISLIHQSSSPLILIGHSMGGLVISMLTRIRKDISGSIALAPAYILGTPLLSIFYYFLMLILYFFPKLFILGKSNVDTFPNEEVCKKFYSDPFVFNGNCALNTIMTMVKYGDIEKDIDVTIPFYLTHGSNDTVVSVKGSRIKQKHLLHEKSRYDEFEGLNHVLVEEKNKKEQFENYVSWINDVVSSK